jgi:sialate O-acetylesterase
VQYQTLFPAMIAAWRKQWGQGEFPFVFVQLANFKARKEAPGESAWAELREAQRLTLAAQPNTGMAVIVDIGEANNIHPKNKQDVGARLAAWALHNTYGRRVVPAGPLFRSAKAHGKDMVITFEHAAGLATDDDEPVRGFAVAGRDKVWVWAQARIAGETVVVSHPDGKKVKYVRYAWADNPACNLVNGAALPASPFRTDDLPLTTEGKR